MNHFSTECYCSLDKKIYIHTFGSLKSTLWESIYVSEIPYSIEPGVACACLDLNRLKVCVRDSKWKSESPYTKIKPVRTQTSSSNIRLN